MKNYWRNSRRFADLINGSLFHGDSIIHAEDLTPCDTEESTITENRAGKSVTIQRSRDILKMYGINSGFTLIGLENQQNIHPHMPLRIATYDMLDYINQHQQWEDETSRKRKLPLIPIYTLIIYYGENNWKDNLSLTDLMDIPEHIKPYINDWHCKVISVKSCDRNYFSDPEVFSFFQACQQLYSIKHNLEGLKGIYLTKETAIAVGTVTGTQKLIEIAESSTEGELINMCTALNNLLQEKMAESRALGIAEGKSIGIAEGKSIGIAEGKSIGIAEGKAIAELNYSIRLFRQGKLSLSEAAGECRMTEEEFIQKLNEQTS